MRNCFVRYIGKSVLYSQDKLCVPDNTEGIILQSYNNGYAITWAETADLNCPITTTYNAYNF